MQAEAARRVDEIESRLGARLISLASPEEMAELELVVEDDGRPSAGTRPCAALRDARGRRFLFKAAEPYLVAGEIFAFTVRRLGRRPAVPVVARTMELPGIGAAAGMLQPFVEHEPGRLDPDAAGWSPVAREAMLREHPWEWLVANLDTHADQYVPVGPEGYPLNIDWDHALIDLDVTELDRFTKRMPAIAPVRNMLYDAYVHGRIDLDFSGMRREVRRIARLSDGQLDQAVAGYAAFVGLTGEETAEMRRRFRRRKRDLSHVFDRLIGQLRAERRLLAGRAPASPGALAVRAKHAVQDAWQRMVVTWMHDRVLAPLFRVYRRLLALGLRGSSGAR